MIKKVDIQVILFLALLNFITVSYVTYDFFEREKAQKQLIKQAIEDALGNYVCYEKEEL